MEYINLTLSKILFYFLIHHCRILFFFFSLTWTVTYSEWIVCFSLTKYITSKKKQGTARAELKHSPWADGQQGKWNPKWRCQGRKGLLVHSALDNYSSSFQLWGKNIEIKDEVVGCLRPGETQSTCSYPYFAGVERHHTISLWSQC